MPSQIITRYASVLIDYMKANGLYTSAVLNRPEFSQLKQIEGALQGQTNVTISRDEFAELLNRIDQLSDKPLQGHEIARYITAAHLGVLGYVLLACPNLGAALMRLERYAKLVDRGFFMQVGMSGDILNISWPLPPDETYKPLFAEVGVGVFVEFARNLTGVNQSVEAVYFMHDSIGDPQQYREFYGVMPHFGHAKVGLDIKASNLGLPLRQPDENLLSILEQQAQLALKEIPSDDQFLLKVHSVIISMSQHGLPTLEDVASQLNISGRTLQRRLTDHGYGFKDLIERSQLTLAEQFLKDERLQLIDVAQLLGYSDQSAFTRAFKRWTKSTPRAYREKLLRSSAQQGA